LHFTLSDFLLDLTQNSVEAGARRIMVRIVRAKGAIEVAIEDNGKGMDEETLARVRDPFFTDGKKHAKRRVGLGIPFLVQALEQVDGEFSLESVPSEGTCLRFSFPLDHVDTPQLGDLPGFFLSALCFEGEYELVIQRVDGYRSLDYELTRSGLVEAVGDLHDAASLVLVRRFLESQEECPEVGV
jgi:hypothetical protein